MKNALYHPVEETKKAALNVLLHNMNGPYDGLPRTAAWGYPEPYTRDLMISALGILASGNEELIASLRKTLKTLAQNQTHLGDIPSLVHDARDLGSSDVTPLFLIGTALFRKVTGESNFLEEATQKALTWMDYQSPGDDLMIIQMPTTDWRDEQWVWGYGLYVNILTYIYNKLLNRDKKAETIKNQINKKINTPGSSEKFDYGLELPDKPFYALWSFKIYKSERFDLLGNSLAILAGVSSQEKSRKIIHWIDKSCDEMRANGDLGLNMPPNLFPFIRRKDPDWRPRYEVYNRPGNYHNGGIWPFVNSFYVVALLAAGFKEKANQQLIELTHLVKLSKKDTLDFGFNEWVKAQSGKPKGQDWQTWSAAMYYYAATCAERGSAIFFEDF